MKIYIVVPAYNEGARIGRVLHDLEKTKLPVIVVDDGSRDKTYQIAKRYGFMALRHEINLGKGAAMKTGAIAAFNLGADAVIFIDSDGQHRISDLSQFTGALKTNKFDVVFGVRDLLRIPFVRRVGNSVASILVGTLFDIHVLDLLCGYRALTKKAFRKIDWKSPGYSVETEMVAMTGKYRLRHCEVAISTVYYDKFKGLSPTEGLGIIFDVLKWKFIL
jgi:glycosyltransferase involved in cell wall biosynthesis